MTLDARSGTPAALRALLFLQALTGCGLGPLEEAERATLLRRIESDWPKVEAGEGTISVRGEKVPGEVFAPAVRETLGERHAIRLLKAERTVRSEHSPRELTATFAVDHERGSIEVEMHLSGRGADEIDRLGTLTLRSPDWTVSLCRPCSTLSFDPERKACPSCGGPWSKRIEPFGSGKSGTGGR